MGTKDNYFLPRQFVTNGCDDESFGDRLKGRNDPPQLVGKLTSCLNNSDLMKELETSWSPPMDMHERNNYKEDNSDLMKELETSCSPPEDMHERNNYKEDASEGNICTEETDCVSNTDSKRVNRSPLKISLACCNGYRKEVNEAAANGFISTKKYRNENDRKCSKNSQENRTKGIKVPNLNLPLNEIHMGIERSPFYDRTNVSYKVTVPENTGKWQCPQKPKPDVGPPLKQLRLTQWVRRVQ
ncbi:hypothetical protein AQUCO_05300018v1 [Aquilegia coerulea]|uniref:Uncharacterized protein n=1 Tax=Aquilegia coerulea TaxID=218851 RepID=A0A2G5CHW1_AQUCA|nr:hypothetical protein AQUCO_05300018v1 [Aquilegia coerulea]